MSFNRLASNLATNLAGNAGASSADVARSQYKAVLGSNLVEVFDANELVTVSAGTVTRLVGLVRGTVLTPVTTAPVWGADSTNFGGRPVIQCANAGSAGLTSGTVATLLASGTRPWWYSVGRVRAFAAGPLTLVGTGTPGVSDNRLYYSNGPDTVAVNMTGYPVLSVSTGVVTTRCSFQYWSDGVNVNFSQNNAAPSTTASALALSSDNTGVTIGCATSNPVQFGNYSAAVYLFCAAKPTAAQIAALEVLTLQRYPV